MQHAVESHRFVLATDAHQVEVFERQQQRGCHARGEQRHHAHGQQLHAELWPDVQLHHARAVGQIQLVLRGQQARHQGAKRAAAAVHSEGLHDVIHAQPAQQAQAEAIRKDAECADEDRSPRVDNCASRRDGHQSAQQARQQLPQVMHIGKRDVPGRHSQ